MWIYNYGSGRTYLLLLRYGKRRIFSALISSYVDLFPPDCYRKPSTTHLAHAAGKVKVTHPFHPLHGMEFELVNQYNCWGENRAYFYNPDNQLISLPSRWTNIVMPDPFVIQSAGRCILHYQYLPTIVKLLKELKSEMSSK